MNLEINYANLLDIINIHFKCYYPLNKFVSKNELLSIIKKYEIKKKLFFPYPIYLSVSKKNYTKIKNSKEITAIHNGKIVCNLKIKSFFKVNKYKFGKKIFNTNDKKHPGLKEFLKSGEYFLDCSITNFNKKIMKNINYTYPENFKNRILKSGLKTIAAFHTRNVPHRGHEWIHAHGLEKCDGLLIQPIIGQFKKGEFKEKIIIKTNKKLIKEIYKNKNIFFALFNSYPRYAGPREALLHALVRRNYGCSHFLVGRDHAGVKKYYGKYESQKICAKFEKKLKIKIIKFKEPFLCMTCKNIINYKCSSCNKTVKKLINGTYIRKRIYNDLSISKYYMSEKISKTLNKQSIL